MRHLSLAVLCVSLLVSAMPAAADWVVVPDRSEVHYTSVKKNTVAENNRFKSVSGTLDSNGALDVRIDLASVDTGVSIRDERVREFLFQVKDFPQAQVTATIDMDGLEAWEGPVTLEVPFTLKLHGLEATYTASLTLVRVDAETLLVSSREPVVVDAKDFNLLAGIDKLRELASLNEISPVVPVGFTLLLKAE